MVNLPCMLDEGKIKVETINDGNLTSTSPPFSSCQRRRPCTRTIAIRRYTHYFSSSPLSQAQRGVL